MQGAMGLQAQLAVDVFTLYFVRSGFRGSRHRPITYGTVQAAPAFQTAVSLFASLSLTACCAAGFLFALALSKAGMSPFDLLQEVFVKQRVLSFARFDDVNGIVELINMISLFA